MAFSTVVDMILIADPDVAAVPVRDNGEPLVDLADIGVAVRAATSTGRRVRTGVAQRLVLADSALPDGVRLLVREGHRDPAEQNRIFTGYRARLRTLRPDVDDAELDRLTSRFVSPPALAPHIAGAAVDLTLADHAGEPLWMGTPIDATPEDSANACLFAAPNIDAQARANRDLLAEALTGAGLINYPTEWWHWSFGDRYWAFTTGADCAIYGPVQPW